MKESATYQAVRIGDTDDWRLIVVISETGISAYLKNRNPTVDVATILDEEWGNDPDSLLSRIETAVYDHPQVLDDFNADIAIVTSKALWIPSEIEEEDSDEAYEIYNSIYPSAEDDVMSSEACGAVCLFTLVPGLNAFMQRTFPGAAVHSHIAVLARRFKERSADMPTVFINVREKEADFLAFDNSKMLMAVSYPWSALTDIQYHLYNIMDVYGIDPKGSQVSVSGLREVKTELVKKLREQVSFVMLTMIPSIGVKAGMPVCGALMLREE